MTSALMAVPFRGQDASKSPSHWTVAGMRKSRTFPGHFFNIWVLHGATSGFSRIAFKAWRVLCRESERRRVVVPYFMVDREGR
jgi:hypothetical protein